MNENISQRTISGYEAKLLESVVLESTDNNNKLQVEQFYSLHPAVVMLIAHLMSDDCKIASLAWLHI